MTYRVRYVLRTSNFAPDPNGHGGNRRSLQIQALVNQAGYGVHDAKVTFRSNLRDRYAEVLKLIARDRLVFALRRNVLRSVGEHALQYKAAFARYPGADVILWEDTHKFFVPYLARAAGKRVVALPHNLESLVAGEPRLYDRRDRSSGWIQELRSLSLAHAVFCISREEQWLLNVWGIPSYYLPYYPPSSSRVPLLEMRRCRAPGLSKRLLVVGTAYNPPTRRGLSEQLGWLSELRQHQEFTVDVAGYGTEVFSDASLHPDIKIHGAVSPDRLLSLVAGASAFLAHQLDGLGALTRIPEMLTAGLPVIANSHACRSQFGTDGVYCYDSIHELQDLIGRALPVPPLPAAPRSAEETFARVLGALQCGG